ncbi:hypothetical protein [Kordia sp.]|uniref:hypothetical protein n=1 Tax=Kordia sp. TaxID=1965332 RepID=UPI0025C04682|nr:hypothetical protein [Kordia sp.]MCH2194772.1 hypothetical protein [Kordia sp.]
MERFFLYFPCEFHITTKLTILYISEVLKFFSVPAAAFEFLSDQHKQKIEQWVTKKLPDIAKKLTIYFFVISLTLLFLAHGSIFLVILCIAIGIIGSRYSNIISKYNIYILLIAIIFSVLQQWIIPESWIITLAYPLEWICDIFPKVSIINSFLADYNAEQFVISYQGFFSTFNIDSDIQNIWVYLYKTYLFATKGLLVLIIIILDVIALLFAVLAIFLLLLIPSYFIIQLSKYLKKIFNIEEKVVPVAAFIIWSLGEIIAFYFSSREFFDS